MGIQKVNKDVLISLGFYRKETGYTNAGALLADYNNFPGIVIVKLGDQLDTIQDRTDCEHVSILEQYETAFAKYRQYYQQEQIRTAIRTTISKIPEKAFREAIANALVHRNWEMESSIRVLMFNDHIEITSPGSLPQGISPQEFLTGQISVLRNPQLATFFLQLKLVEKLGTGIRRIMDSYQKSVVKPQFKFYTNSLTVILPVLQTDNPNLPADEAKIYEAVRAGLTSMGEIISQVGFSRSKSLKLINKLIDNGYLIKIGSGRGIKYHLS